MSGETAFLPTVTGDLTGSFAEYARTANDNRAAIDAVVAALAKHPFRPLYPLSFAGEEVLVNGAWVMAGPDQPGKRRRSLTYDRVRVVVTAPADDSQKATRFESLVIFVAGKEVARRTGAELPDLLGCSARRMKLEGTSRVQVAGSHVHERADHSRVRREARAAGPPPRAVVIRSAPRLATERVEPAVAGTVGSSPVARGGATAGERASEGSPPNGATVGRAPADDR